MRREGYDFRSEAARDHERQSTGETLEPIEYLVVDVPEKTWAAHELWANRKGELVAGQPRGQVHLESPSRQRPDRSANAHAHRTQAQRDAPNFTNTHSRGEYPAARMV